MYTVLEMMDGGSLADLVARHAVAGGLSDEGELARIARRVLLGLSYLHRTCHQVQSILASARRTPRALSLTTSP